MIPKFIECLYVSGIVLSNAHISINLQNHASLCDIYNYYPDFEETEPHRLICIKTQWGICRTGFESKQSGSRVSTCMTQSNASNADDKILIYTHMVLCNIKCEAI